MGSYSFLAEESAILLYAGRVGLEIGLMYDFFRILRRGGNYKFLAIACMDLLFWGFVAGRTFYVIHTYSNGTLRWFAILGIMVILALYLNTLSGIIVRAGDFFISVIKKVFASVKKCLTKIMKFFIIKIRGVCSKRRQHGKKSIVSDKIS